MLVNTQIYILWSISVSKYTHMLSWCTFNFCHPWYFSLICMKKWHYRCVIQGSVYLFKHFISLTHCYLHRTLMGRCQWSPRREMSHQARARCPPWTDWRRRGKRRQICWLQLLTSEYSMAASQYHLFGSFYCHFRKVWSNSLCACFRVFATVFKMIRGIGRRNYRCAWN